MGSGSERKGIESNWDREYQTAMMSSSDQTVVSIGNLEKVGISSNISPIEDGSRADGVRANALSENVQANALSEKEFQDKFVRVLSSGFKSAEALFMAKADECPRFIWLDVLLSFQSGLVNCSPEQDNVQFRKFGQSKFSHIIDAYPDILQRELLRDSFELAKPDAKRRGDRYGVLHAAVLCRRVDLVDLMKDPDMYREKICKVLCPTDDGFNSFSLIRRAVLWSRMHMVSVPYAKAASFLKEFGKAWKPLQITSLRALIDNSTGQIDLKDKSIPDPWVVVLAWASTSPSRRHIIDEFKTRKQQLFEQILKALTQCGSSFAYFLTDDPEEPATDQASLHDRSQQPITRTVESIVKLLVLVPPNPGESHGILMQRLFLDRLSDRAPNFRWSPLHIAAANGDHEMVSNLITSCDKILDSLGEKQKKIYTTNIEESFLDAKYMTPLHHAVLGNHKKVVEYLLGWRIFKPYVNESDIFMRTALQMACSNRERAPIVYQLMQSQGVDLNTKDCCLFTCLHWAVFSLSTEVVQVLISEGRKGKIRTTEKDSDGIHPYELASRCKAQPGHSKTSENADPQKDIQLLLLSSPAVKDEVETLYRDRQVYVDASNAILVGAALIASVTFGGWLQPPLGTEEASPSYGVVNLFWAFSSLSFFFSIATVMSGAAAVLPIGDEYIKDSVKSIRRWLILTSFLLILSVAFVLGAFAAAGFAALSPLPHLRTNMTITTSIGSVVCGIVGLLFCSRLWRVRPDWLRDWVTLTSKEALQCVTLVCKEAFQRVTLAAKGALQCSRKEEVIRKVKSREFSDSEIREGLSCQRAIQVPASRVAENGDAAYGPQNSPNGDPTYGPQNSPSLINILGFIPTIIESLKPKYTMQRSESLPAGLLIDSGPPATGVTRERIARLWKDMHTKDGSKASCLIRDCYRQLELHCHDEIVNFNINTVESLKEFVQMWSRLSPDTLQGTTVPEKVLQKVKELELSGRGLWRGLRSSYGGPGFIIDGTRNTSGLYNSRVSFGG